MNKFKKCICEIKKIIGNSVFWTKTTDTIHPIETNDNVAIGTTSSTSKLHVKGVTTITAGAIAQGGSLNLESNDETKTTKIHTYDSGDFGIRTESGVADALAIDDATQNVGCGITSPTERIHAYSTTDEVFIKAHASGNPAGFWVQGGSSQYSRVRFNQNTHRWEIGFDNENTDKFYIAHGGNFANKYLTLQNNGNVGISETSPATKLHVDGDVLVEDDLILKSPDGSCWAIRVSNMGILSANSITCP